jgi:hypothetical protein
MASIVLTLPNAKTIVVIAPNGDQVVPVTLLQCVCGTVLPHTGKICDEWFAPSRHGQIYFDSSHQKAFNDDKARKTSRRQTR